ncbi:MAG: zinc-ribbon domain-containing protein [Promethearchaeota archaeon]
MAKFCSNCGENVEEGTEFCSKCGTSLLTGALHSQDQHVYVHSTGRTNADIAILLGLLYWLTFFSVFIGLYFAYKAKKENEPAKKVRTAMIVCWFPIVFTFLCVAIALAITLT